MHRILSKLTNLYRVVIVLRFFSPSSADVALSHLWLLLPYDLNPAPFKRGNQRCLLGGFTYVIDVQRSGNFIASSDLV